jgi:hypothetical protein
MSLESKCITNIIGSWGYTVNLEVKFRLKIGWVVYMTMIGVVETAVALFCGHTLMMLEVVVGNSNFKDFSNVYPYLPLSNIYIKKKKKKKGRKKNLYWIL